MNPLPQGSGMGKADASPSPICFKSPTTLCDCTKCREFRADEIYAAQEEKYEAMRHNDYEKESERG